MTVSLSKGQSVSLKKRDAFFSDININLKWNMKKSGFFGFGKSAAVDLDLGCLYELKNGQKGAVQALGDAFGSLHSEPYVKLNGDDRSGANTEGETMIVSGQNWDKISRVLVYSFIYQGVAKWSEADGVIHLKTDSEHLEVKLDESQNGVIMCAIAMLENINGELKVTKLNQYFAGHKEMDRAHGWGMNWTAGSK